jgi:Reverse transcriptase (RNA-dependent DNA polymerase)
MQTYAAHTPAILELKRKIRWAHAYQESELIKAALRVYTKPLFAWRKALSKSQDGRTLYDFARHGLQNLDRIHKSLAKSEFHFRPGLAHEYNFNGKRRTLYIYPWEERIVDLLLYRIVGRRLDSRLSSRSFAYREHGFGVDRCQRQIAAALAHGSEPLYVFKRDVSDYFPSINHAIMLEQLAKHVDQDDYLWTLLCQRVQFQYREGEAVTIARRGVPFGTPIACLFANLYLTELDEELAAIQSGHYFRYADDLLFFSSSRDAAMEAAATIESGLVNLGLKSKASHEQNFLFRPGQDEDAYFVPALKLRHLGIEFRASGPTGLSRDKFRKICNLFRAEFRRSAAKYRRIKDAEKRVLLGVKAAQRTIEGGVRNVAIVDYYLKHVDDEGQLRRLDRWLAEEVLAQAFGGHRKGHFYRFGFDRLRAMGLPSLVHRRRLLRHGRLESPFFIWKQYQQTKSSRGMAARPQTVPTRRAEAVFSPDPEAAAQKTL